MNYRDNDNECSLASDQCQPTFQKPILISFIFFGIGFSAITALAIALLGWLSLDVAAFILVAPAVIIWIFIGMLFPDYGRLAIKGFFIGILACFFYDCMRFLAIALGLWGDFIPKIGVLLLHSHKPNWVVGYLWRYIGDGGFMSVSFVVTYRLFQPRLDVRIAAVIFGSLIWLCLLATIEFSPPGILFSLTPTTFGLSLIGHFIYGLSIGILYRKFIRE